MNRALVLPPRPRSEPPVLVSPVEHMRDPVSPVEPPGLEPVSPAESYHRAHGPGLASRAPGPGFTNEPPALVQPARVRSHQPSHQARPHQPSHRVWSHQPSSRHQSRQRHPLGPVLSADLTGSVSTAEPTRPVSSAEPNGRKGPDIREGPKRSHVPLLDVP